MNNLEFLSDTIVEAYDEKLADITMNNPENNWSEKEEDNVGGKE